MPPYLKRGMCEINEIYIAIKILADTKPSQVPKERIVFYKMKKILCSLFEIKIIKDTFHTMSSPKEMADTLHNLSFYCLLVSLT